MLFLFLLIVASHSVQAASLAQKYPSYRHVFTEFDVPLGYIKDSEFQSFSRNHYKGLKSFYKRSIRRGKNLLPMIKGSLNKKNVSELFIYLAMVESGFSTKAVSNKKAAGLWQFMPNTAKHYNLNNIGSNKDERYNAVRSTNAAIKYLKKLHRQFGKWYLAAMAYNCGEGCVDRAIKKAGSKSLSVLTNNTSKYLPKETRNYIRKILLTAMIGENYNLGFSKAKKGSKSSEYIDVKVPGGTKLKELARIIGMKYSVLKKCNPSMKNGRVPNKKNEYTIVIPLKKIYAFYLRYELREKVDKKLYYLSYQVLLGDTPESIAKKFNIHVTKLVKENNLKSEYLEVKQFLIIPTTQKLFDSYQHN